MDDFLFPLGGGDDPMMNDPQLAELFDLYNKLDASSTRPSGNASVLRSDFDLGMPFGLASEAQQHPTLDTDTSLWHGQSAPPINPSVVAMGIPSGLGSHVFADEEHSLPVPRPAAASAASSIGPGPQAAKGGTSMQALKGQQDFGVTSRMQPFPPASAHVDLSSSALYPRYARAGSVGNVDMSDGTGALTLYAGGGSHAGSGAAAVGLSPLLQPGGLGVLSSLGAPAPLHTPVDLSMSGQGSAQGGSGTSTSRTRGGKAGGTSLAGGAKSIGRGAQGKTAASSAGASVVGADESSTDESSVTGGRGRGRAAGRSKNMAQTSARAESSKPSSESRSGSVTSRQAAPVPVASAPDADSAAGTPSEPDAAASSGKSKKRFLWTEDLHKRFVSCIFDFGLKNATPKTLFELMQPGPAEMTSDHIKSHLQKFRNNSAVGREVFLKDFEQARQEAEARAEEAQRTTGQVPFPTHFSTYPVSMASGSSADMAEDGHVDGAGCARCERFSKLIVLGVGLPESDSDLAALQKEAHSMVQAHVVSPPAASQGMQQGAGAPSSFAQRAYHSNVGDSSAFPPYREQAHAFASGSGHGIHSVGGQGAPMAILPHQNIGALTSAPVLPGQVSDQSQVTNQLLSLLRQYVTQQQQVQQAGAAGAHVQQMAFPAVSSLLAPSQAQSWPLMTTSAVGNASSMPNAPAPIAGQPHVAAVLQQVTAAASTAQTAGGKPVSYADLLRLVRAGKADAAALAQSGMPSNGPAHLSQPPASSGPASMPSAGASAAAATPGDAFAAMSRAMAAQMRMHRAMMHRQEGQLQTYGQEAARTPVQQGTPDSNSVDKPVRKGSISSDDSGGNGVSALGPALDAGLIAAFEAPVTVGEIHAEHAKDAVGGIRALFEQRFSLGVLDTLTSSAPRASVEVTLASGRQVRLPSAAATATGLVPSPSTVSHSEAGAQGARQDNPSPAQLLAFLTAAPAKVAAM